MDRATSCGPTPGFFSTVANSTNSAGTHPWQSTTTVLTMIFFQDQPVALENDAPAETPAVSETPVAVEETGKKAVVSPLKGTLVKLSDVKDEAFASGMLGDGVAIEPAEGVLYAPADGTPQLGSRPEIGTFFSN